MNVIETRRLNLRELELDDADFVLELLNEPGFIRHIGDKGVRTLGDAGEYILRGPRDSYEEYGFGLYAVSLGDGTRIGICGLVRRDGLRDPDVGYAFLSRYWGHGYAVEAAAAVLAHAREVLHLERVVAITTAVNLQSIAVLEKLGFEFECLVRLTDDGPELKLFGPAPRPP